jgi:two-component system nitrate/nitrite response regulator NarL
LRLGASDYLIKPCSKQTIFLSITRCLENNKTTKSTLPQYPRKNSNALPKEGCLSKRELQVYNHLVSGMPDKSIAKALDVKVPTIKFHTKNIYRKLGVSGRNGILKILSSNKG